MLSWVGRVPYSNQPAFAIFKARGTLGLFIFPHMPINPTLIFIISLFGIFLLGPEAKRTPRKYHDSMPTVCKVMADSVQKLYDKGDPTYLTWDISPKCDSSQLYTAYYYQGLGFYLLSAWKESLYFLSLAKQIGGAKDEEILYHIWNVNKKLNRYQEMERATLELHRRYPNSFFLMEILEQWKSVKQPSNEWFFGYTSKMAFASNAYLDQVISNRINTSTGQKNGNHHFRETASLTVNAKLNQTHNLQGFQGDLGGEYEYNGFTAELNYGAGYDARNNADPLVFVKNGNLIDSNWNWEQGRMALGYSYTTKSGWNLGLTGSALQIAKDWQMLGLTHSQSFLFPNWILLGYVDLQMHFINKPPAVEESTVHYQLHGLNTFMASLTPYFSWEKISLATGLTYYYSRSTYRKLDANYQFVMDEGEDDHSLTASVSNTYDLRNWFKINLGASYGQEYIVGSSDNPHHVYSIDAGFSLSY